MVYLLVICTLKQVLPLSMVEQVLQQGLQQRDVREFYQKFRELFGASLRSAVEETVHLQETGVTPEDAILGLALKAQAEQTLAQGLLSME